MILAAQHRKQREPKRADQPLQTARRKRRPFGEQMNFITGKFSPQPTDVTIRKAKPAAATRSAVCRWCSHDRSNPPLFGGAPAESARSAARRREPGIHTPCGHCLRLNLVQPSPMHVVPLPLRRMDFGLASNSPRFAQRVERAPE